MKSISTFLSYEGSSCSQSGCGVYICPHKGWSNNFMSTSLFSRLQRSFDVPVNHISEAFHSSIACPYLMLPDTYWNWNQWVVMGGKHHPVSSKESVVWRTHWRSFSFQVTVQNPVHLLIQLTDESIGYMLTIMGLYCSCLCFSKDHSSISKKSLMQCVSVYHADIVVHNCCIIIHGVTFLVIP